MSCTTLKIEEPTIDYQDRLSYSHPLCSQRQAANEYWFIISGYELVPFKSSQSLNDYCHWSGSVCCHSADISDNASRYMYCRCIFPDVTFKYVFISFFPPFLFVVILLCFRFCLYSLLLLIPLPVIIFYIMFGTPRLRMHFFIQIATTEATIIDMQTWETCKKKNMVYLFKIQPVSQK